MPNEYETHDIPDIGEFRAKRGTATSELAGAASYWNREWRLARKANATMFSRGLVSGLTIAAFIAGGIKLGLYLFS